MPLIYGSLLYCTVWVAITPGRSMESYAVRALEDRWKMKGAATSDHPDEREAGRQSTANAILSNLCIACKSARMRTVRGRGGERNYPWPLLLVRSHCAPFCTSTRKEARTGHSTFASCHNTVLTCDVVRPNAGAPRARHIDSFIRTCWWASPSQKRREAEGEQKPETRVGGGFMPGASIMALLCCNGLASSVGVGINTCSINIDHRPGSLGLTRETLAEDD